MTKHTHRIAVLAVAATLALSACTGGDKAAFDDGASQGQSTSAQQGQSSNDENADASTQSAAAAEINPKDLGKPLATAVVPAVVEGDPDPTMEVALYSLKRDGKTLTGTFSFKVISDTASDTAGSISNYLGGTQWKPYLVDTANLARHHPLGLGSGRAMTDSYGGRFLPGQTFYAYAAFAAPADDVTSVTVNLVDGAPAASKVAIQ
ncbi:hypothetical protein GCM10023153_21100 [Ornithinibacter aureus]|uniref:Uncharacterized protein n=1 Tax=Ornithinibacter aureus TaxID=622664 RepID=A0ABP8JWZ5_9MICO|nr:hypothetical protein [Ornithinibacter aureus]KAF0834555.1 hypothetical protein C8E84_2386 [Ornithinibacter aureus]